MKDYPVVVINTIQQEMNAPYEGLPGTMAANI